MGKFDKYQVPVDSEEPPAAPVSKFAKYQVPVDTGTIEAQTHPVSQDVIDSREQRKNDAGRHDIRAELYGPKQTGLESYARGAADAIPGVNLLMDEEKLEAARAWNPNETALGDVMGAGAPYMLPVGEMGQAGKWLGEKAVAKFGAEAGPRLARVARGSIQAGGIGAAQGASQAAKHGDAGDIAKGALVGGGLAAGLAGLGGASAGPVAEYAPGPINWLMRQIPRATAVVNRAPMATALYQGGKEALDPNATTYDRTHGALNGFAVPALGTAVTHIMQQGGAAKITPKRILAESELAGASAKKAGVEVPKKLDADYEHNVRAQREQAEHFDRLQSEGEGLARDVNKGVDERVAGERKEGEELLAAQEAQRRAFDEKESAARANATDLLEAQKLQKADHDARVAQGQDAQSVQRAQYVAEAGRQARAEAQSAYEAAKASFEAATAASAGAKTASGTAPVKDGPTPRATAEGEARQIHGKAGTRLSHELDAVDRKVVPDSPKLRERYKYVMDSIQRNDTRELVGLDEIMAEGGFEPWVEKRTAEIAAERAAEASGTRAPGAPVDGHSGPQMNRPTKPSSATGPFPRVPVYPDLEGRIISKDLAAVPDPALKPNPQPIPSDQVPAYLRPNPQPRSVIPRKSVGQHAADAQAAGAPVPDFRALAAQAPVSGPVDNGYGGLREIVSQFAKDESAKTAAEAPANVRAEMTRAGVSPGKSVPKQFESENPRLLEKPLAKAIDLLPSFRSRRVGKDLLDNGDVGGKPLNALANSKSHPAEAAYVLREVEGSRGKVDARRAKARVVDAGATSAALTASMAEILAEKKRKKDKEKGGAR